MANFARSLNSPRYLSPRLRPTMPGRTMSSSSDVSVDSTRSEDFGDFFSLSGRNTPTLPGLRTPPNGERRVDGDETTPQRNRTWGLEDHDAASSTSSTSTATARPRRSRPIAIELPQIKRFNTTSGVRTPPEPLSARGDLPGGYFPLHEDPSARVHRPHPFHHEHKMGRLQHSHLTSDPAPVLAERNTSNPTQDFFMSPSHAPVTSYLPAGFHDHALPLGKYYPSNYEQRNAGQSTLRPSVAGSLSSTIKSDSQIPIRHDAAHRANVESEVRRRLQQYQRDMMTQASMAASEILADPAGPRVKTGDTFTLNGLPIPEMRFNAPSHKPRTPNLLPLGSPGPVTPMELESAGGDYLAPSKPVGSQIDPGLTPPMVGLDPHST